jgi:hypothetical protein
MNPALAKGVRECFSRERSLNEVPVLSSGRPRTWVSRMCRGCGSGRQPWRRFFDSPGLTFVNWIFFKLQQRTNSWIDEMQ